MAELKLEIFCWERKNVGRIPGTPELPEISLCISCLCWVCTPVSHSPFPDMLGCRMTANPKATCNVAIAIWFSVLGSTWKIPERSFGTDDQMPTLCQWTWPVGFVSYRKIWLLRRLHHVFKKVAGTEYTPSVCKWIQKGHYHTDAI